MVFLSWPLFLLAHSGRSLPQGCLRWVAGVPFVSCRRSTEMMVSIKKQTLDQLSKLPLAQQQLALNSASSLMRKTPRGGPGKVLSRESAGGKFGPDSGNGLCVS